MFGVNTVYMLYCFLLFAVVGKGLLIAECARYGKTCDLVAQALDLS